MRRLRDFLFSANSFVAAMLALFVSIALGFERPFWAMATVYIVSQPLAGTVRSKAVFRFGGTVIGAIATVLIVPPLANAPILLTLAMAVWVCGCQFLSLLDRTPRSYLFMLAGYTAAIIGFPSVDHPDQVFNVAILRAQEIGVGVACATLVHTLLFPRNVSTVLTAKLDSISRDAQAWTVRALSGEPTPPEAPVRRTLAADVTELHLLATHVPYDTETIRPTRAALAALQDRLMLLIPLISAIDDRVASLNAAGALTPELQGLLADTAAWVTDPDRRDPDARRAAIAEVTATIPPRGWINLLTHNLLARLVELTDLLSLSHELIVSLRDDRAVSPQAQALVNSRLKRPLHIDLGMASLSVLATFVTIVGACLFWIFTAWPEGAIVPMIAAVMCCFFATLDDPTVQQRNFLTWTVVSLPLTALYQFAILPAVHGFVMLTLVLAPTLLFLGYLMPSPKWGGRMLPLVMGFSQGLALTNVFSADFAAFAGSNFAQLAGVAVAIVVTRLFRVIGPQTAAKRVLHACWRELAAMAGARSDMTVGQWTGLMLDRIQLLAPRLADASTRERLATSDALRDLRIGINVIVLKEAGDLDDGAQACVDRVLGDVAGHFAELDQAADPKSPDPELMASIDRALAHTKPLPALIALTGLRRNLFPDAPAPLEAAA